MTTIALASFLCLLCFGLGFVAGIRVASHVWCCNGKAIAQLYRDKQFEVRNR